VYRALITFLLLMSGHVSAHQFTPTYPKLESSFVNGVKVAKMELFNSRNDARYYELGVFDGKWEPVSFASEAQIVDVPYLTRKSLNIYIRDKDVNRAVYICSKSKLIGNESKVTMISTRICSKIK